MNDNIVVIDNGTGYLLQLFQI